MLVGDGRAGDGGVAYSGTLLLLLLLLCIQSVLGVVTRGESNTVVSPTPEQQKNKEAASKQEQVSQTQTVTPDQSERKQDDKENVRLYGAKNAVVDKSSEDAVDKSSDNAEDNISDEAEEQDAVSHEDTKDVKRDVREQDQKRWGTEMDERMMGPPRRLSLAAQLIARLVTLTTGRRPPTHHSQPLRGLHGTTGNTNRNPRRNPASPYGRLRKFGHGRRGWGLGRWQGRAPRIRNYHHPNNKHSNTGEKMFNRYGHGVPQPRKMPQPKTPNLHGLRVPHVHGVQAPNLHGMSLPRSPHLHGHYQPNLRQPQPPRLNNLNVPRTPQMPKLNSRGLPRMYSPGVPNTQVTLNMITRMIREGKIPPINFNCNSNNHILHLVQQHTEEDKKKRRKKRSLRSRYQSSSEESEQDEEYSNEDYTSNEVEAKRLFPLLKRVEAKDIHALSHQMTHPQMMHPRPYSRPIIHHHGPRILLVCISNTYLSTIIKQHRGSGSDESD